MSRSFKQNGLYVALMHQLNGWRSRRDARELKEQEDWAKEVDAYERRHDSKKRRYTSRLTTMEGVRRLIDNEGNRNDRTERSAEEVVVETAVQAGENKGMSPGPAYVSQGERPSFLQREGENRAA